MADEIDVANDNIDREMYLRLRNKKYELPKGKPGDCDMCGEWSGRLIGGVCAPCRDKYGDNYNGD